MATHHYQGGNSVEIFSPSGSKSIGSVAKIVNPKYIRRYYDKELKGNVVCIDGDPTQTKFQLPHDDLSLGLIQSFLVLQIFLPQGQPFSVEFSLTCLQLQGGLACKQRLIFSSSTKEVEDHPLHLRIPLILTQRNTWLNLCFDLPSFLFGRIKKVSAFRTLDTIIIGPSCRIRKIFTLKTPLQHNYVCGLDIPRSLDFPLSINHQCFIVDENGEMKNIQFNNNAILSEVSAGAIPDHSLPQKFCSGTTVDISEAERLESKFRCNSAPLMFASSESSSPSSFAFSQFEMNDDRKILSVTPTALKNSSNFANNKSIFDSGPRNAKIEKALVRPRHTITANLNNKIIHSSNEVVRKNSNDTTKALLNKKVSAHLNSRFVNESNGGQLKNNTINQNLSCISKAQKDSEAIEGWLPKQCADSFHFSASPSASFVDGCSSLDNFSNKNGYEPLRYQDSSSTLNVIQNPNVNNEIAFECSGNKHSTENNLNSNDYCDDHDDIEDYYDDEEYEEEKALHKLPIVEQQSSLFPQSQKHPSSGFCCNIESINFEDSPKISVKHQHGNESDCFGKGLSAVERVLLAVSTLKPENKSGEFCQYSARKMLAASFECAVKHDEETDAQFSDDFADELKEREDCFESCADDGVFAVCNLHSDENQKHRYSHCSLNAEEYKSNDNHDVRYNNPQRECEFEEKEFFADPSDDDDEFNEADNEESGSNVHEYSCKMAQNNDDYDDICQFGAHGSHHKPALSSLKSVDAVSLSLSSSSASALSIDTKDLPSFHQRHLLHDGTLNCFFDPLTGEFFES